MIGLVLALRGSSTPAAVAAVVVVVVVVTGIFVGGEGTCFFAKIEGASRSSSSSSPSESRQETKSGAGTSFEAITAALGFLGSTSASLSLSESLKNSFSNLSNSVSPAKLGIGTLDFVDGLDDDDDDNRFFRTGRFARRDRLSIGLLFGTSFSNAIVRHSVEITVGARTHETTAVDCYCMQLSSIASLSFFFIVVNSVNS